MPQVLRRSLGLLKRPWVALGLVLLAGAGVALVFVPLFGVPGFELSLAMSAGVGLIGGGVGFAAAAQERRLLEGRDPRPRGALRAEGGAAPVVLAAGAATGVLVVSLVVPLVAATVYALTSTRCDPFAAIAFYPVLTLPSAVLAASAGMLCGFAVRKAGWGFLAYGLLVAGSLAATVAPIVFGPQVFAFNHFLGYFPGPLYDESLAVGAPLLWFRLETLLLAAGALSLAAWLLDPKHGQLTRPHLRPGSAAVLGLCGFAVLSLEARASSLGTRMSDGALVERLGGLRETAHFLVVYPRGKSREQLDRFERDLELRYAQVRDFLGGAPEGKVHVWLYRSAEEKAALVGAAHTQFAKPWRLELHLNDSGFPHPALKHELAHVLAARYGSGPFRVSARWGLLPVVGIIEGLAVAADNPADELTLHEWSAGMRQQKLMPDVRTLLGPEGFYGAAPARAYTAAGSFLRYLAETEGAAKLTKLYADGNFDTAYGRTLDALAADWEKFLDGIPLDGAAVNQAFARFRRGSLFTRACAREVAQLSDEAAQTLASDPERALELYRRCATIQPDEPSFGLAQAAALDRTGRKLEAAEALQALAVRFGDQPATLAEVEMAAADLAYRRGKPSSASEALEKVLATTPGPAMERTARVKRAALESPEVGPTIWSYFQPGSEDVKLLVLRESLAGGAPSPWVAYLLGRRLAQGSAPGLAAPYLETALAGGLPPSIQIEALRLLVEAHYLSGACPAVRSTAARGAGLSAAVRAQLAGTVERCDFEEKEFKGPLVPEGPFR